MLGREVVIVEAVRTPIGRGHPEKGVFRDVHPNALLGAAYLELIRRAGIDAAQRRRRARRLRAAVRRAVVQHRPQRVAPGRPALRDAGDDDRPPVRLGAAGGQLRRLPDRHRDQRAGRSARASSTWAGSRCSSGAGSSSEVGTPYTPELYERYDLVDQGLSAELIAERWGLSRERLTRSPRVRSSAPRGRRAEGRFEREIVAIETPEGAVTADQGIRPETTVETLAELKPVFKEDGTITAGNSSQISDGAAAVLLASRENADELGLRARARMLDQATVGVDPVLMLTGPIPGDEEDPRAQRADDRRPRPDRDQRGIRLRDRRLGGRARAGHGPRQPERRRDRARPSARLDRRPPR